MGLDFTLGLDVKMDSPPISPPRLHGSSRTTDGVFCNHALGNAYNAADFNDPADEDEDDSTEREGDELDSASYPTLFFKKILILITFNR